MTKKGILLLSCLLLMTAFAFPQDEFLKIECSVSPRQILQGNEGLLKIKIIVRGGVKISANPEFLIRLDENESLSFAKIFFAGSELNIPTTQENSGVFLDPQEEIEVPFKLDEGALLGNLTVSGDVVFTMLFPDNWSVKTTQKFSAGFVSRRNYKLRKK
ncbi:MAG: hypothetical protein MUC72_00545 [Acidobacteria bacterium]|jgi:hypothetical protein|nr:hypothetical protein [Acidobacteriota bacterium]